MTSLQLTRADSVERTLSWAALALGVALVALAWPVAEATRFLVEKLLCPKR